MGSSRAIGGNSFSITRFLNSAFERVMGAMTKTMRIGSLHISLWVLLLVASILLMAFGLLSQGNAIHLAILVGGLWVALLCYYHPMPAIFMLLILSTNVLMFIDMKHLPFWQLGPGLRVNLRDGLLLMMTAVSLLKLVLRREQPAFLKPMLILGGVVLSSFLFGLLFGITDLDVGMNCFRTMFTYIFYVVLVASIDSRDRLRTMIRLLFLVLMISVAFQVVEAGLGRRLTLGLISEKHYDTGANIMIEGQSVPYLWNRATIYLYIGLFMALGAMFSGRGIHRFLPIVLMGALGFVISLTRTWYLLIGVGFMVIFALQRGRRFRAAVIVIILAITGFTVLNLVNSLNKTAYHGSLMDIWIARLFMISSKASTFVGRTQVWKSQLEYFRQLPLFGYGMSPEFINMWNTDTGLINTLLQFGIIGLGAIIYLIVSVYRRGYKVWKNTYPSVERGYVAGTLGLWTGLVLGYSFNMDFFTMQDGIWGIAVAMAIIDRVQFLQRKRAAALLKGI